MIKNSFLFVIVFFHLFNLLSQEYSIANYSIKDGLPNSCVYDVFQDNDGFIWLSTDNGLSKFNGKTFENFNTTNGLEENTILSTAETKNQLLISSFKKGIFLFDKKEKVLKLTQGPSGNPSKLICQENKIWLHNPFEGVKVFNISSKVYDNTFSKIDNNVINCINQSKNGQLYIGTTNGAYFWKDNQWLKINNKHIDKKSIIAIAANQNVVVVCTMNEIVCLDSSFKLKYKVDTRLLGQVYNINVTDDSSILLITRNASGFYKIKDQKITDFGKLISKKNTDFNLVFEDEQKNIWVATCGEGIYCMSPSFIQQYEFQENTHSSLITSILPFSRNELILGTVKGPYLVNNNKEIHSIIKNNSTLDYVYDIIQVGDKIVYLSINNAVKTFQYNGFRFKNIGARAIYTENNEIIYLGTWLNSIDLFSEQAYLSNEDQKIFKKFGNEDNRVNAIKKYKEFIYVGTDKGLIVVKGNNFKFLNDNKIVQSKINEIYINGNKVYIGSELGVGYYEADKWIEIKSSKNQSIGSVKSIEVAVNNNNNVLFVGTLRGLFVFDGKNSLHLNQFNYLSSPEINKIVYSQYDNLLYLATNNGYYTLDYKYLLNLLNKKKYFRLENIEVKGVKQVIQPNQVVQLKANERNFRINFQTINYEIPNAISYVFSVDGGKYIETTNPFVEISQLSSGKHTIRIKCIAFGGFSKEILKLNVDIEQYWYYSWWFYLLIFCLLLGISFLIYRYRINSINKRNQEKLFLLSEIDRLKYESLNASINPHFVFNALNSIQHYINKNEKIKASDYLGKFSRLIRLVLDKDDDKYINIEEEVKRMSFYLELEQVRFENFNYTIQADDDVLQLQIPNMIVQPIIENAILHGIKNLKNGFVEVRFFKTAQNVIEINVEDNGCGFKLQNASETNKRIEHKSFALKNIQAKIDTIPGASISFINKEEQTIGVGTLVVIKIPLT